jgi:hypothetical protein
LILLVSLVGFILDFWWRTNIDLGGLTPRPPVEGRDAPYIISEEFGVDSSGPEVRPEVAFAEARRAIANYRFRKLVQTDTAGFDPLTQWYLLAWDTFKAREFVFDEARQLALAIGGFNVEDLSKV